MSDFYVYTYIDPRNYEEFYFGKGRGSRKSVHLGDSSDSEKTSRIAAIRGAGLDPIIRVIASGLTEPQAYMIEKTLLWKLGKNLTNVSSGYFAEHFRPHNTMHEELTGFDFENGIYYFNIGDGPNRQWADNRKFGFISSGQGKQWRKAIHGFRTGDVVAAYLKNRGFVGIGRIIAGAKPIRAVTINNVPLLNLDLACKGMSANVESDDLCEHVALVDWITSVDASHAKWSPKSGLYTTTNVRASLDGQPTTKLFLEAQFKVRLDELVR